MTVIVVIDQVLHQLVKPTWMQYEAASTAVLIPLIGEIYAVLLAFLVFVIWTQFTDVENCVVREVNSLNELVRYTSLLTDDQRSRIRHLVTDYVNLVVGQEWTQLGNCCKDPPTADAFFKLTSFVVSAAQSNDQVLETLRSVCQNRNERVAKSITRMPPTLSGLVQLIAVVLWLLLYVYSFQSWPAGPLCYSVAALVLFIANFVMTDTDNPLKGLWNVRVDPFVELPR